MTVARVIKKGKVAVVCSPGFGAGWSTWNREYAEILLFHPKIVAKVLAKKNTDITEEWMIAEGLLPEGACPYLSTKNLVVAWLPVGTQFQVTEYDGSEKIETRDGVDWFTV